MTRYLVGRIGQLVSNDFTSSMIYVPLLQHDGLTGKRLDYGQLASELNGLRKEYAQQSVTLHIIGFGVVVGDMISAGGIRRAGRAGCAALGSAAGYHGRDPGRRR